MYANYTTRYQCSLTHTYFADGICRDFSWIASADTQYHVRNGHIVVKQEAGGLVMLFHLDPKTGTPPWLSEGEQIRLTFYLQLREPAFLNYTDLPLQGEEHLYHFNTQNADANGVVTLGTQTSTSDAVPVRSSQFSVPVPAQPSVSVRVTDTSGNVVWGQEVDGTQQQQVPIDLQAAGSGVYTLQVGEGPVESFYAYDPPMGENHFAVVEFEVSYESLHPGQVQAFTIPFEARSTYWNYYIVPQKPGGDVPPEIRSAEGEPLAFEGPSRVQTPDSREAWLFTSETPLTLLQRPGRKHELVFHQQAAQNGIGKRNIVIPLPGAQADAVRPIAQNNHETRIFSDIYVYV